jgi:hypothetical protein
VADLTTGGFLGSGLGDSSGSGEPGRQCSQIGLERDSIAGDQA